MDRPPPSAWTYTIWPFFGPASSRVSSLRSDQLQRVFANVLATLSMADLVPVRRTPVNAFRVRQVLTQVNRVVREVRALSAKLAAPLRALSRRIIAPLNSIAGRLGAFLSFLFQSRSRRPRRDPLAVRVAAHAPPSAPAVSPARG